MKTKRYWLLRILAAGLVTVGIVVALVWWQERGLDAIEKRLVAGDVDGALVAVDRYLMQHPADARGIALRARALVLVNDPQQAVLLFERVGAAEVEDLRSWSTALMSLGQWDRALPILGRIRQISPNDGRVLEQMTICHFELGHRQAALDAGHRLSQLPGFEAAGHLQLASIYTEWNSALNAAPYFKNVLRYRPDAKGLAMDPHEFFLAYIDTLLAIGNARQALELLGTRTELPSIDLHMRKGKAWQTIGDFDRAQESFEHAVRLEPAGTRHAEARRQLAEIALQQGDAAGAVLWLQPLVDKDQVNAFGAYLLVRAYTLLGEENLCEQWLAQATAMRLDERRLRVFQAEVAGAPTTPRARVIAAYVAAANQDWKTAGQILASLLREVPEAYEQPFVEQLVAAVQKQARLPAIGSLPPRPE